MKRIGTAALTLALAGAMTLPALAAEPQQAAYSTAIFVNGQALDTSAIPAVEGLPMRLVAEADHGSAAWFEEEGTGSFYLEGNSITVTFATGAVEVNDTVVEGVSAQVKDGVTFLPVSVLSSLEGYSVEESEDRIDITTPNNSPLVQLAYSVQEASGAAVFSKAGAEDLEMYGIKPEHFTEVVGLFPMITSPDTVIVGKVAEGELDAVKEELEAYRQQQEDTFNWYLTQHLPKVKDARVEVEGDYILFLIGENADAGVEAFRTGVAGL